MPFDKRHLLCRHSPPAQLAVAAGVLLACVLFRSTVAAGNLRENFEGPQTSWRYAATDATLRVTRHARAQSQAHWGHGCEELRLAVGNGTFVYFEHDIGHPTVIDELQANVWVRANRPGVQLLARVVFPRVIDEASGQPVTMLVRGTSYTRADAWENLTLTNIPALVARQARVLRLQLGRDIDERGAYLDRLVINACCAPGEMQLLIDDLEVTGFVASGQVLSDAVNTNTTAAVRPVAYQQPENQNSFPAAPASANAAPAEQVELRSATLTVGDQPFFPRIIEHRGEPLEYLKQLGFNGVRMFVPPTASQLAEARRLGLWFVCPPPDVLQGETIGPQHDRVLAWQLGEGLAARHTAYVRQLADAVRRADGQTARPLAAGASEQLRTYSRQVDILFLDRRPLGSPLELEQLKTWIAGRSQLARPGTPLWMTVQTQPLPALVDQWSAGGRSAPRVVEPQQIRLLAHAALAAGARGLMFASHERLDQGTEDSQLRAQSLALLNMELELIDPWLAVCTNPQELRSLPPDTQATMFPSTRSHLLVATKIESQTQFVASAPPRANLPLVVPGIPDSTEAYVLTPAGLKPLQHQRVTGGVKVEIEEFGWVGTIVFTSDPLVYARLAQTSARNRARAAELQQAIVTTMIARTKRQLEPLAAAQRTPADVGTALSLVDANMNQCRRLAGAGDAQSVYTFASRAEQSLAQVRRATWDLVVRDAGSPTERLTLASFETLGDVLNEAPPRAAGQGTNRLAGGNMEDLNRMLQSGWRHVRRDVTGVRSNVDLAAGGPFGGRYVLRLEAVGNTASDGQAPLEDSPLWVHTGDMPVRAGQRIEIHGQVRIDKKLAGQGEGLLVYDSLGGRELGLRCELTEGWREFVLYRAAPRDGVINITLELNGLGIALVDNLEVVVANATAATGGQMVPPTASRDNSNARLRNWFGSPR